MTVYIDVLVFVNSLITYFLLLSVCCVFKFRPKTYRLIIGAVLGGLSALTIFIEKMSFITEILIRLMVCAVIVFSSFSYKNKIRFLKLTFSFFAVTYIFAGVVLAVCEIFEPKTVVFANGITYFNISPLILILTCGAAYVFIRILMLFKKNTASEQLIFECFVEFEGVCIKFLGINDTGNSLCDPYFNSAAVIVEKSVLEPILMLEPKKYLIPVSSVAGETTLFAFRPSAFYIYINGKRHLKKDVTICISDKKLHNQYNGILSSQIIETGEELCLNV
ncbi:MAG: sigma-E processing peptidase SpoIIGA [Clostridia bacterium]|nr:sigma-E processing peptidase SpoIIGA [Clostridia bacterium]